MPRVPYPDPSRLSETVRQSLAGMPPVNVVRMLSGASAAVFDGLNRFSTAFFNSSALPPPLRELAILRVGCLSRCEYEVLQHEILARQLGYSDVQIAAIKTGGLQLPPLTDAQQAVLDFTDDIIVNVRAADETLARVRKHLSDEQLLDLILVIGLYMAVARVLETTGTEMDTRPVNWDRWSSGATFDDPRPAIVDD